eukprot:m.381543 g.381543  ORF g.381543 m.381543 type:complete len:1176 (-) comp20042_c0_seq38:61-3588(-)
MTTRRGVLVCWAVLQCCQLLAPSAVLATVLVVGTSASATVDSQPSHKQASAVGAVGACLDTATSCSFGSNRKNNLGSNNCLAQSQAQDAQDAQTGSLPEQPKPPGQQAQARAKAPTNKPQQQAKEAPACDDEAAGPCGEPLVCGTTWTYWSTNCGTIGSAASRFCSAGGRPVNSAACATHFERGSRGCGMLYLGCQALCRVSALPCVHGRASFVTHKDYLCGHHHVELLVQRDVGSDGAVEAWWAASHSGLGLLAEGRVAWEHGDASPKAIHLVTRAGELRGGITVQLVRLSGGLRSGHIMETTLVDVCAGRDDVVPVVAATSLDRTIHVDQTVRSATVELSLSQPVDHVVQARTVIVAGPAKRTIDYSPPASQIVTWEPGSQGLRLVTVPLRSNTILSSTQSVFLTFVNVVGGRLEETQPLFEIRITHKPPSGMVPMSWQEIESQKLLSLPFATRIKDLYLRRRFLEAWHEFPVRAGETVIDFGAAAVLVFALHEGELEVTHRTRNATHMAVQGELLGLLAALRRMGDHRSDQEAKLRVVAKTDGVLWAIETAALLRLASFIKEVDVLNIMRRNFLKRLVEAHPKKHPIVLLPGFMSSRLEAWKASGCGGMSVGILDPVWISLQNVAHAAFVDGCFINCLKLGVNQTDSRSCRLRPMTGLSAITALGDAPLVHATTIFRYMVQSLASEWGYEANNLVPLAYDWRLSPWTLETRDAFFTKAVAAIELAVAFNRASAIAIGHSLGSSVFLQFVQWLKATHPGWRDWLATHITGFIGIGAPLLGAPAASRATFFGDRFGLPVSVLAARSLGATFGSAVWMQPREELPASTPGYWLRFAKFDDSAAHMPRRHMLPLKRPSPLAPRGRDNKTKTQNNVEPAADGCVVQTEGPESSGSSASDTANNHNNGQEQGQQPPTGQTPLATESGWPDAVFTVHGPTPGQVRGFSAKDIAERPNLAEYLVALNDTLVVFYHQHLQHYNASPDYFNPLASILERPPIRNVAMIYGTDRDTLLDFHVQAVRQPDDSVHLDPHPSGFETRGGLWRFANGTVVDSPLARSGDGTVPYTSLAAAHSFHVGDNVFVKQRSAKTVEYYEHLLGRWGERTVFNLMNTVEPAYLRFKSFDPSTQAQTTVFEIDGLGHRQSVKDPFVINRVLDEVLLDIFERTFCSHDDNEPPWLA